MMFLVIIIATKTLDGLLRGIAEVSASDKKLHPLIEDEVLFFGYCYSINNNLMKVNLP